jgi:hypothetical protein
LLLFAVNRIPMYSGFRVALVLFAGVCVFAIVLFPAPTHHGPFNAVYGPTTDLRSSVNAHQVFPLMLSLMLAARLNAPFAPADAQRVHRDFATVHSATAAPLYVVLRC